MGKGYNNYMCKKFFHPTSFDNLKRKWMAEQKDQHEKKQEDDKLAQYRREQEVLENRILMGDEKARLGLAWLYDQPAPPEKPNEDESEVKFEWQRKYNAPRETYAKTNEMILDQPFGIEVRNVRCVKCHKWGHMNTDRICPLYGKSITMEPTIQSKQASSSSASASHKDKPSTSSRKRDKTIMLPVDGKTMQEEGLAYHRRAAETGINDILLQTRRNLELLREDDHHSKKHRKSEAKDPALEFLKNLSDKQRKKLLKKLEKAEKKTKH